MILVRVCVNGYVVTAEALMWYRDDTVSMCRYICVFVGNFTHLIPSLPN